MYELLAYISLVISSQLITCIRLLTAFILELFLSFCSSIDDDVSY